MNKVLGLYYLLNEKVHSLRLSEEKYKNIFNAIPHPSYIWQRIENDLILMEFNKAAENFTEGKIKSLIGIKASEHYKERPSILEDLKRCLNNQTKFSREVVHKLVTTGMKRNLIRFYDFIEPDLVLVHTEDISERKRVEQSLKKEEREKSLILDAVSDLILYYDKDQNIIWANKAASDSLNLPNEDIIGHKCYELWQNRKEPCENCPVVRAKDTGTTQSDENETPDGRIWMILGFPVRNDEENIIGMVEITRDITEAKIMQKKLKDNEQFLQNVFNAIQDGVSILDRDLNVIRVNHWMEKKYSSKVPLVGKKCFEIYQDRSSICPWCPSIKTIETGDMHSEIVPYPSEENPTGWIDLSAFPLKDNDGNVVNVIEYVKDITKQKKAEYKLRESEEKYRGMAELLPDVIFEADLDMNLKYVNPAGFKMFGYSSQDLEEGINLSQLLTPDSLNIARKRIKDISEGITTSPNEYELLKKDGYKIYCRVHSRPIIKDDRIVGLRGTVTDITDIKLAEQKLKESEEKYRILIEKSLQGICILQDVRIIFANEALSEILGYSIDELLSLSTEEVINLIHPDDRELVLNRHLARLEGKPAPSRYEFRVIKKDGLIRVIEMYASVINLDNKPAVQEVFIDITERKKIEEKLKKSEEKYREAYNRINLYKDLFTHDINNIFQNILSSNELAMLYSNTPEKLQDYVEVSNFIKEQVSRGAQLVSNVQKLSELEEFKKPLYSIEVCSVLNSVINSTKRNFLHKKIEISFDSLEKKYLIKANELIFDVFENILINAVKHNREPTIEIQIKISKNIIDNTNYVKMEFIDNGIGIPDIMKDIIFQRDVKKEKAGGIGLGLLLIKRILESYNGNVKVEDKIPGDYSMGSNFIVQIPEA